MKTFTAILALSAISILPAKAGIIEQTESNETVGTDNAVTQSDVTDNASSVCNDEQFQEEYRGLQDVLLPSEKKWKRDDIVTVPKFGGYIIGSYKYDDGQEKNHGDGFGLRLIRLYVDGTVLKDFKYRIQFEANGNPHIKDATLEWVRWKSFQIKAGQFKRAFTFENPMNPWDIGAGDYSQLSKKLAGYGDRCGEASMGGRDLGVQLQGDLFKSKRDDHYQLHYQLAAYNGQGINTKDQNKLKDFIGTIQYSPIKNLWLGAFGWLGSWYSSEKQISVDRNRYAFSVKYDHPSGWNLRAEYARSHGFKASDWDAANKCFRPEAIAQNGGDKADAWYATLGIPVWRWIKCFVKYDAYRDYATNSSLHSIYSLTCNLQPHKNLMLQLQYNYNDDKTSSAPKRHYNQLWAQMYVRF